MSSGLAQSAASQSTSMPRAFRCAADSVRMRFLSSQPSQDSGGLVRVISRLRYRLPTTSSEFERTRMCGRSVCTTTLGLRGSVTSTPVKFLSSPARALA
mgnify:CR=1 FL=1